MNKDLVWAIGLGALATFVANVVAAVLSAILTVATEDVGGGTTFTLLSLATAAGACGGAAVTWRRGGDSLTSGLIGAATAFGTQMLLIVLGSLGGSSIGLVTIGAGVVGAVLGGVLMVMLLRRRE
ncbi:MAG: hypothetical protein ACR2HR_14625 [Euzebya sp.]